MAKLSTGKPQRFIPKDGKKEALFRDLVLALKGAGFEVRREKLKGGHGWKVVSGTCRAQDNRLIFVDNRMPQDDQILFLQSKIRELGISLISETASKDCV